jgi:hypothetical protein
VSGCCGLTHAACALQFRKLGYEAVDMICEYMKTVPEARVVSDVQVSEWSVRKPARTWCSSGQGQEGSTTLQRWWLCGLL